MFPGPGRWPIGYVSEIRVILWYACAQNSDVVLIRRKKKSWRIEILKQTQNTQPHGTVIGVPENHDKLFGFHCPVGPNWNNNKVRNYDMGRASHKAFLNMNPLLFFFSFNFELSVMDAFYKVGRGLNGLRFATRRAPERVQTIIDQFGNLNVYPYCWPKKLGYIQYEVCRNPIRNI